MNRKFYLICSVFCIIFLGILVVTYYILMPQYETTYIQHPFLKIGISFGRPCFFYTLGILLTASFKNFLPRVLQYRVFKYTGIAVFVVAIVLLIAITALGLNSSTIKEVELLKKNMKYILKEVKNFYYICQLYPAIFLIPGMLTCLGIEKTKE